MPLNYRMLRGVLQSASRALPKAQAPVSPAEIAKWIKHLPFFELQAGDTACEQYVATKQWPQMDNAVLAQVHLRMEAAMELCQSMMSQKHHPEVSAEDALKLLLIEYWHGQGPQWAARRYGHLSN